MKLIWLWNVHLKLAWGWSWVLLEDVFRKKLQCHRQSCLAVIESLNPCTWLEWSLPTKRRGGRVLLQLPSCWKGFAWFCHLTICCLVFPMWIHVVLRCFQAWRMDQKMSWSSVVRAINRNLLLAETDTMLMFIENWTWPRLHFKQFFWLVSSK